MSQPVYLRWQGGALHPLHAKDREYCRSLKEGQTIRVDRLVRPRNPRRHGFYWAMLGNVVEATGCTPTSDHLHDLIKLKTGYVRTIVLGNGEVAYVPDSTAWDAMGEAEFAAFLDHAIKWLSETFGVSVVDLVRAGEKEAA